MTQFLYNCCVCLETSSDKVKLSYCDSSNNKVISKLKNCIGEIDWLEDYMICLVCYTQLDIVYNFRQLCLESYDIRQKVKNNVDETIAKSDNTITCITCSEDFTSPKSFNTHVLVVHENLFCTMCYSGFKSEPDLQKHNKTYHMEIPIETEETIKEQANLIAEENSDGDDLDQNCDNDSDTAVPEEQSSSKIKNQRRVIFSCEMCDSMFKSSTKLINHSVDEHKMDKKDVKPFPCPRCSNKFASSSNLNQHMKYHEGKRNHMCSYCGRGFVTKCDLKIHEKQHLNQREYNCPHCPKNFNTHKDLRSHKLVVHTDPSQWTYICNVCNKRFPIKSNYDTHMRRHNNDKRFSCHLCDKTFCDKCVLQRHMRSHSNVRAYKCSECWREYKDKRVMELHMAKIHNLGDIKVPVRVKKHFCHICPKAYFAKNKLTRHLFSHSGEKPFLCRICNKKFSDGSYVKHHMQNVHNFVENSTSSKDEY